MRCISVLLAALALAGCGARPPSPGTQTGGGSLGPEAAAHAFLSVLVDGLRTAVSLAFDDPERLTWSYVPQERAGGPLQAMNAEQRADAGVAGEAGQAAAPATPRDSVIAVVQEFFRAMAANDVEASRRVLLPDGVRFSTLQTPEGLRLRRESNEAYLARLAQNENALFEHIREMMAHVQGAIAMVWAPYDFYVNGEFSHCGTNAITLIRVSDGWRIASSAWTIENAGCEPSPPGPQPEE